MGFIPPSSAPDGRCGIYDKIKELNDKIRLGKILRKTLHLYAGLSRPMGVWGKNFDCLIKIPREKSPWEGMMDDETIEEEVVETWPFFDHCSFLLI